MPNPKHEVRSKRMFCAYVLKTRRFLTPALMVHGSRPRWYTNHVYTQHSIFPLCDVLSGCATPISTTLASLGYWYSKENLWPRRDLNTQPSDLESDALPLRHRVMLVNDCWASQNASSCQTCTKSVLNWNRDWKTTKFRQLFNYCFKWLKCLANVCLIQF